MKRVRANPNKKHRKTVRRRLRLIKRLRRKRWRGRVFRFFGRWTFRVAVLLLFVVVSLRWVNPPITYLMASERWRLGSLQHEWVNIEDMSQYLPLSAAAAEDAKFCDHSGFDIQAIREAINDTRRRRGGSTISQQVVKNVFLWPARSWLRKGLEAGFTVVIEIVWPKQRIMEVYLNVAEFGEGVFGVEAASQKFFGRSAAKLNASQAARLMAVLPNPHGRSPTRRSRFMQTRSASIISGAGTLRAEGRAACFLADG